MLVKEFLKYLKMIPVIIYPYIYVVILAIFLAFMSALPSDYNDLALLGLMVVAVIYNLYSFIVVIINAVQGARGKMTARQAARMRKEGLLSTAAAILMGIGCFIYCVDIVIAIVYVVKAGKRINS